MRRLPLTLRRERAYDPEFHKVKTQLANVATALEACICGLDTLTRDYDRLYTGLRKFANDFYSLYPSEDEVRHLGEATVTSADQLLEDVNNKLESTSVYIIDRQIRAYLTEIKNLQKEFRKVAKAKSDYESEKERLARADRRGVDEDRRTGIYDTMHMRKQIYETTLSALTNRLSSTYNKHSQVFQAAWTAYILKLDDGRVVLDRHLRAHRNYAKKVEKDVVRMQLGKSQFKLEK